MRIRAHTRRRTITILAKPFVVEVLRHNRQVLHVRCSHEQVRLAGQVPPVRREEGVVGITLYLICGELGKQVLVRGTIARKIDNVLVQRLETCLLDPTPSCPVIVP